MKKKQLLALALAGAMTVGTAASLVPSAVYAAEKTEKDTLKEAIAKHDVKDINVDELTDAQVKELLEIIKEVEVLEGKKLGNYNTKAENVVVDRDNLAKKTYRHELSTLKNEEMISFRTRSLNQIEKVEGKAVKVAEEMVAKKQAAFDKIPMDLDNFSAKNDAFGELAEAQTNLETARKAYMDKMNALAETINSVEMYQRLNKAITSVTDKYDAAIVNFKATIALNEAKDAYLSTSEMKTKYPTSDKYDKAKTEAEKKATDAKKGLLDKVNSQLKEADKIEEADLDLYLAEDDSLNGVKKALIDNKLTKEDVASYKALVKEANKFSKTYVDATDVTSSETAYNNAYDAAKEAKKDLLEKTEAKDSAVKNLDIAIDAIMSATNFKAYDIKSQAAEKVKEKFDEAKKAVRDAKTALESAKEILADAEKELAKDSENEVLKVKVQTAKVDVKNKEEALEKAEKAEKTVKEDYERLQSASKDLYEKFKAYSEATIKGAGKEELKARKARVMESLKKYNEFAKEFGLSEITVTMNEVAEVGVWYKDANGTWFYRNAKSENMYKNDWAKIDNVWYRFDENGAMLANKWFKDTNNRWYWLNASGRMSENEWINVNGSWFFAYGNGAIAENEWVLVDGTWYYAEAGGYIAMNKTVNVNGVNYSFDATGALK